MVKESTNSARCFYLTYNDPKQSKSSPWEIDLGNIVSFVDFLSEPALKKVGLTIIIGG